MMTLNVRKIKKLIFWKKSNQLLEILCHKIMTGAFFVRVCGKVPTDSKF